MFLANILAHVIYKDSYVVECYVGVRGLFITSVASWKNGLSKGTRILYTGDQSLVNEKRRRTKIDMAGTKDQCFFEIIVRISKTTEKGWIRPQHG